MNILMRKHEELINTKMIKFLFREDLHVKPLRNTLHRVLRGTDSSIIGDCNLINAVFVKLDHAATETRWILEYMNLTEITHFGQHNTHQLQ